MRALRHALAIAVLPFTMTVIIPSWIGRREQLSLVLPDSPSAWLAALMGLISGASGLFLFLISLRAFDTEGAGTLAPWDPPRHLVIQGPYAYVRNPMISGVVMILLGEGLTLRSPGLLLWCGIFAGMNMIFIPLLEEPRLRSRFGREYQEYVRHVPRLIPRRRPWRR